jgi:hypothetical protein
MWGHVHREEDDDDDDASKQSGKEVERVMKQNNLTPDVAINRQLWRRATENQ